MKKEYLLNDFLEGPFPIENYRKNLPYFLSLREKLDFEENLKTESNDWKYRTKEIRYDLNSSDYRTLEWKDIDWENSIAIFGCSHVFGEGLPVDETFCHQLQELSGRQVVNLGVTGSSTFFSWHNNIILHENFPTPYAVVNVWTDWHRLAYYGDNFLKRIGPWSGTIWDEYDQDAKKLYYLWNNEALNPKYHFHFISTAARLIWQNKTKYLHYSFVDDVCDFLNIERIEKLDQARDKIHYGYETNKILANKIWNDLK